MAIQIKMRAKVSTIIQYAEDVYQVTLTPEKNIPRFKAGQFLHLALDEYDSYSGLWPESRAFSLASSSKKAQITIVYSVKGAFTQRMRNELQLDKNVWLKFPYGSFCVESSCQPAHDIVLIAGGTGIAPYVPYLEEELEQPSGIRILLAYGIRGEHCFLFKRLLQTCCQCLPGFELILFNTQPIDFIALNKRARLLKDPYYFISGPQPMIKSLREFLLAQRIGEQQVHIDDWG